MCNLASQFHFNVTSHIFLPFKFTRYFFGLDCFFGWELVFIDVCPSSVERAANLCMFGDVSDVTLKQ